MVTLSEPTLSRKDERFFKSSLFIPKIEDEKKRQELTDALQFCHVLMLHNGLNTAAASNEISIRSAEIGKEMFFCLTALIKEILSKSEKEVPGLIESKIVDSSHPKFTELKTTLNNVTQPDVKTGVSEEREIEEITISSSEDESSKPFPSSFENEHTERKFQQEQSQLKGSTEPVIHIPLKKKSKKEKEEAVDSEFRQYKEYLIDSWVYEQIKILRKRSAPINVNMVKQLAVKASAIYAFPEFKPTMEWCTTFSKMYNVTFDRDEERGVASVSLPTGEDECFDHGIIFRKKKEINPFMRHIPSSNELINLQLGKFCGNPAAWVDLTPIEVDLSVPQKKYKQPKKKPVKTKNSSGKNLPKKPNGKNKRKRQAKKNVFKQMQMNAWVFEQLKIMRKNSIPIGSNTVDELAVKAGNIFLQSGFKPGKEWKVRFWKIYRKPLERFEEDVSNPTEIIQEEITFPQPMEEDTAVNHDLPLRSKKEATSKYEIKSQKNQFSLSVQEEAFLQPTKEDTALNHDLPLGIKKEARSKYEIKKEKNQSSISVKKEAPYDSVPLTMKKENPKSDVVYLVSSEEIYTLSSDDECLTNSSSSEDRKSIKKESIS